VAIQVGELHEHGDWVEWEKVKKRYLDLADARKEE
jgi:hypothetical protein